MVFSSRLSNQKLSILMPITLSQIQSRPICIDSRKNPKFWELKICKQIATCRQNNYKIIQLHLRVNRGEVLRSKRGLLRGC